MNDGIDEAIRALRGGDGVAIVKLIPKLIQWLEELKNRRTEQTHQENDSGEFYAGDDADWAEF